MMKAFAGCFPSRLVAVAAAGAAAAWLIGTLRDFPNQTRQALEIKVERRAFVERLELRGHVEPTLFVDVQAPTVPSDRQLIQIAPEGSSVNEGDVVAEFDQGPLLNHIEELNESLRDIEMTREEIDMLMKGRLFEMKVGVQSSRQDLILSELKTQSLAYEADLRMATNEVQLNMAKQRIRSARGRVENISRQREARSESRVVWAERLLERIADAENALQQFTAVAPTDSIVLHPPIPIAGELRKVEAGDFLGRGQAFLRLPDLSSLVVRLYLDENQVDRVREGAKADIVPVADSSITMHGEVSSISRLATLLPGHGERQFFQCELRIDDETMPTGFLKVGMVVDVTIPLRDFGNVFAIPRDAAWQSADGSWNVRLQINGELLDTTLHEPDEVGDFLIMATPPTAAGSNTKAFTIAYLPENE